MKYILSVIAIILLSVPQKIFALEGLATCSDPQDCNFCTFTQLINNVVDWVMVVSISIAVLLIVYAGFKMAASRGNVSVVAQTRSLISNAAVGIIILLAAFTIVDTIMKATVGGSVGLWNQPNDCGEMIKSVDPTAFSVELKTHEKTATVFEVEGPESMIDPGGGEITPYVSASAAGGGSVSFAFSGALAVSQQGHLSGTLASLQACVASKVVVGTYIITSVSDNQIANGSKTWAQCAASGCAHTRGSCHYGGSSCVGKSYALDIRTSNLNSVQRKSLKDATTACGGWPNDEGNHIHISKGAGCGCN